MKNRWSCLGLLGLIFYGTHCSPPPLDLGPAPIVQDISVHQSKTTGGIPATLTGQNFLDGAVVTFGDKASPSVQVVSPTQIQLVIPQNDYAQGPSVITVTHPDHKSGSNGQIFSYIASQIGFEIRSNSVIPAPYDPTGVALGDLDQDGRLDIAFTNVHAPNCATAPSSSTVLCNSLGIAYGSISGQFTPAQYLSTGQNPEDLLLGDFNKDGLLDVATLNNRGTEISVLQNTGIKTFAAQQPYGPKTQSLQAFTKGDLDGDGTFDLVAFDNKTKPRAVAYFGDGNGQFGAETELLTSGAGGLIFSVAIADMNGDNKNDIIMANVTNGTVSIFFNMGNKSFSAENIFITGSVHSLAIADMNGDGVLDVLTAGIESGKQKVGFLKGFFDNGNFKLAAPVFFSTVDSYTTPVTYPRVELKIGDFDQDGDLDVAVTNAYGRSVNTFSSDGQGNFTLANVLQISFQPRSLAVGDLDNDGALDLLIGNYDPDDGTGADQINKRNLMILYNHSK